MRECLPICLPAKGRLSCTCNCISYSSTRPLPSLNSRWTTNVSWQSTALKRTTFNKTKLSQQYKKWILLEALNFNHVWLLGKSLWMLHISYGILNGNRCLWWVKHIAPQGRNQFKIKTYTFVSLFTQYYLYSLVFLFFSPLPPHPCDYTISL